jgi:hypothetical protein
VVVVALIASQLSFASETEALDQVARVLEGITMSQEITLIDSGRGKKRAVRMAPEPGATARYEVVSSQKMKMVMEGPDGEKMDLPGLGDLMPSVVMTLEHTVEQPVKNGLVPVQVGYTDVRVDGAPADLQGQMMAGLEPLKGLGFRLLIDPATGNAVQADVTSSDDALYEMIQSLADQFMTQIPTFPEEKIGMGASWTVDVDVAMAGMDLSTKKTLVVTELTDESITTSVSLTFENNSQELAMPGMPPGAKVDLSRFEGKGEGSVTIDLTTLATTGSLTTDLDMAMTVEAGPQPKMKMEMEMTQIIEMRPIP